MIPSNAVVPVLVVALLFLLGWLLYRHPFRETFEPIPLLKLDKDKTAHKRAQPSLLLHYGNLNLDIKTFSDTLPQYAKKHHLDYYNCSEVNLWQTLFTFFETHAYEYIVIVPANAYVKNRHRALQTLIEQAGDVDLIVSRDEKDKRKLNADVVIFRRSEWTRYKLHQLYHHTKEDVTEVLLDQVYTQYVHKTFVEFDVYLSLGIPYQLSNLCVYHEHALVSSRADLFRYYDRITPHDTSTDVVYPWKEVKHPRFTQLTPTPWRKLVVPPLKDTKIPKVIFQTMESHLTLVNIRSCVAQVRAVNPDYTYVYFTAYDARTFIQTHFPHVLEAYDTLLPGAYKADLWRYCVLYHYGGFYMDSRMYPYLSFDSIITKSTEFMSCVDVSQNMLYQAILAAAPKSAYMKHAIDECLVNIRKRRLDVGDLAVTGPKVMGNALNQALKRNPGTDLTDIVDPRVVLLRWNSLKAPKYLQDGNTLFACHKYTKLLTDEEVQEETVLWLMLTGKEHYSGAYRNARVYKDPLF
jgi:mannosyltransferase OCH1-like enzyme